MEHATLKAFLVFLIVSSASTANLSENCPTLEASSSCKCKNGVFPQGVGTHVECRSIRDTDTLYKEIQKFRGYHVDYFKLIELYLPYLPAGLFAGTSVTRLYIENSNLDKLYSVTNPIPFPFEGLEGSLKEFHVKNTKEPDKWHWPSVEGFKYLSKFVIVNSHLDLVGRTFAEIGGGSLKSIAVRHSRVNRIHHQAFSKLTGLTDADFEGNTLPYLWRTIFPNPAPNLDILNFRNNRLSTLEENMFENMPSLVFLDLSENEFKKFENVVFSPLWNQLQFLFLSDNPFECGCSLLSLKEKLQSNSLPKSNDISKITCINHGQFRKTKLKDIDFTSLQCQ